MENQIYNPSDCPNVAQLLKAGKRRNERECRSLKPDSILRDAIRHLCAAITLNNWSHVGTGIDLVQRVELLIRGATITPKPVHELNTSTEEKPPDDPKPSSLEA